MFKFIPSERCFFLREKYFLGESGGITLLTYLINVSKLMEVLDILQAGLVNSSKKFVKCFPYLCFVLGNLFRVIIFIYDLFYNFPCFPHFQGFSKSNHFLEHFHWKKLFFVVVFAFIYICFSKAFHKAFFSSWRRFITFISCRTKIFFA